MSRAIAIAAAGVFLAACGQQSDPVPPLPPPFREPPPQQQPAHLRFASWPLTATAGQVLSPVTVQIEDESGVIVSAAIDVTLATSAETLGGTTTRTAVNGVATFTDLTLTRAGGATLVAGAAGLAGSEVAITVNPGAASSLAFDVQPVATITAGATMPDVKVIARDAWGNVASRSWVAVTLSLTGAPLVGTTTQWLSSGVATFPGLSVPWAGSGYRLSAASVTLPPATSTPFDVVPAAAAYLVFAVQPSDAEAGDVLTPAVQVWTLDAFSNLVADSRDVTVASPGLAGTKTVVSVGGVAAFADLSVTLAGYRTLTASAASLTSATSNTFVVTPGSPASLAFSAPPPATIVAGATIPTVTVELTDAYGNRCWNIGEPVGVSLDGAELSGTTSRAVASGLASFSDLSVRKAGTGYRLSALGAGLGPVQSSAFDVLPGGATHLAFTVQPPPTSVAGATISPPVAVSAFDAYENVAPATGSVTLSLSSPPPGATLLGSRTVALAGGTSSFGDLSLQKAAAGYRLSATRSGLPTVTSDSFTIVPAAATKLFFTVQPTSIRSGHAMAPAVQVALTDDWLNVATSAAVDVTLRLEANPAGAALAGTTTVAASDGVATFAGLTVREPGTGYRIRATATGLADAVSINTFDVAPHWDSIGPDGGQVTALAADPVAGGVAYAATNGCVWKRSASGTWSRGCQGLATMQIDALAVHPTATQKVFAATSLGLYRSDDGGATWRVVGSLGAAAPYRTLAVAVAASGAIYAGTFQAGIWRSFDDGATWEPLAGPPPRRIKAIALEPASTDVLYAAAVDPGEVGTVYRSLDRGETWAETALGPAAFPGVKPAALLVDPGSSGTIYAGARTGVFELYDRGATAAQVVSGPDVRALAAYGGSAYRYAAGTSGVWRMVVGSEAWAGPLGAASLPSAPNAVAVAALTDGKLLAGTRYGPYSTAYSGNTWSPNTAGLRAFNVTAVGAGRTSSGGRVVYAATFGGGVYRSLDGGASWTRGSHPAENQMFYGIAVERANPNYAWLAGASGLYRTATGGATWTEVFAGQGTMYSTILDPSSDAIVYAGGNTDVYRSTAGTTASFRDLNVCSGPVRAMALSANAPLALWVGTDAGMCRVDLAGVNEIFVPYAWQPGTSGTTDAIAIDPDPALAGSTVWASTSQGFHTTLDGGATWTKTSDRFTALLAQPGKLLGARSLGTVEVSRDGGATFQPAALGLYYGYVRSMADVPGVPDEIYAGTSWGGVFKTTTGGE